MQLTTTCEHVSGTPTLEKTAKARRQEFRTAKFFVSFLTGFGSCLKGLRQYSVFDPKRPESQRIDKIWGEKELNHGASCITYVETGSTGK